MTSQRAPDGFPGFLFILSDVLRALRRDLWALWSGSSQITCPEHYIGGGFEPQECERSTGEEMQFTEEAKAIAEVLWETDRKTLVEALVLAGPETQRKLIMALSMAELYILSEKGKQT